MDCLRSFIISLKNGSTFSGASVKTWTIGVEHYWAISQSGISNFNFQGFKNVDIYGVDVVGGINTQVGAATGGVNVSDWNFEFLIQGELPLASGFIQTDYWGIQTNTVQTKTFALSKNTNSLKFANPIKSASKIEFQLLNAQGYGTQTAGTVSLNIDLSFIVYYKFEGE